MSGKQGSETRQMQSNVRVRMRLKDRNTIQRKAKQAGVSVSAFMRAAALGRPVRSRADRKAMADLNRLGGLFRWWLTDGAGKDGERHCRGKAPAERVPQIQELLDEIGRTLLHVADVPDDEVDAMEDDIADTDGDDR